MRRANITFVVSIMSFALLCCKPLSRSNVLGITGEDGDHRKGFGIIAVRQSVSMSPTSPVYLKIVECESNANLDAGFWISALELHGSLGLVQPTTMKDPKHPEKFLKWLTIPGKTGAPSETPCYVLDGSPNIDIKTLAAAVQKSTSMNMGPSASPEDLNTYYVSQALFLAFRGAYAKDGKNFGADQLHYIAGALGTDGQFLKNYLVSKDGIYNPCKAEVSPDAPQWLRSDPSIKTKRFFECEAVSGSSASIKSSASGLSNYHVSVSGGKSYKELRDSLVSRLSSLYVASRKATFKVSSASTQHSLALDGAAEEGAAQPANAESASFLPISNVANVTTAAPTSAGGAAATSQVVSFTPTTGAPNVGNAATPDYYLARFGDNSKIGVSTVPGQTPNILNQYATGPGGTTYMDANGANTVIMDGNQVQYHQANGAGGSNIVGMNAGAFQMGYAKNPTGVSQLAMTWPSDFKAAQTVYASQVVKGPDGSEMTVLTQDGAKNLSADLLAYHQKFGADAEKFAEFQNFMTKTKNASMSGDYGKDSATNGIGLKAFMAQQMTGFMGQTATEGSPAKDEYIGKLAADVGKEMALRPPNALPKPLADACAQPNPPAYCKEGASLAPEQMEWQLYLASLRQRAADKSIPAATRQAELDNAFKTLSNGNFTQYQSVKGGAGFYLTEFAKLSHSINNGSDGYSSLTADTAQLKAARLAYLGRVYGTMDATVLNRSLFVPASAGGGGFFDFGDYQGFLRQNPTFKDPFNGQITQLPVYADTGGGGGAPMRWIP